MYRVLPPVYTLFSYINHIAYYHCFLQLMCLWIRRVMDNTCSNYLLQPQAVSILIVSIKYCAVFLFVNNETDCKLMIILPCSLNIFMLSRNIIYVLPLKKKNVIYDSFYHARAQTYLIVYVFTINVIFFINCSIDIVMVIDQCWPDVKPRSSLCSTAHLLNHSSSAQLLRSTSLCSSAKVLRQTVSLICSTVLLIGSIAWLIW